jgi:hypothetical protein
VTKTEDPGLLSKRLKMNGFGASLSNAMKTFGNSWCCQWIMLKGQVKTIPRQSLGVRHPEETTTVTRAAQTATAPFPRF